MLYRVTLEMDIEIDSEFILDVQDEVTPLIDTLRTMIKDNPNIGLAPKYRCEMVSINPLMHTTQAVSGQWVETLIL